MQRDVKPSLVRNAVPDWFDCFEGFARVPIILPTGLSRCKRTDKRQIDRRLVVSFELLPLLEPISGNEKSGEGSQASDLFQESVWKAPTERHDALMAN